MKSTTKLLAIKLRQKGYLYSEIAQELGIAKSTACVWTKEITLSAQQMQMLDNKYKAIQHATIEKMASNKRMQRLQREQLLQKKASKIVNNAEMSLNLKRIVCASLFWCEGAKDVTAGVAFINSDPDMISTFLKLFRQSFEIDETKFRALVHLHEYHDVTERLAFWSELTSIPLTQFHKPYLKPHTGINRRYGYPGCISIRYLDSSLGKLLKMIYIEFSKNM